MTDSIAQPGSTRGRVAKQERSARTRRKIVEAAVVVLARYGVAGLTHRLLAEHAGVSLAATTYYYESKFDIIADASGGILGGYIDAFDRAAARYRADPGLSSGFSAFPVRLVRNAAGRDREGGVAWCEIMLDAARRAETRGLARTWFGRANTLWLDIAEALGAPEPHLVAPSAIENVVGLLFMILPLGLSDAQIDAVFIQGVDAGEAWRCGSQAQGAPPTLPAGRKAHETRERILTAAIEILIASGTAGVTYGAVATKAGLSGAAPAYHFRSIDMLLGAAQARLFEESKNRYRSIMAGVDYQALDMERLIDLTAAVFLREATQFGPANLASYSIWLEAVRQPQLRPMIWSAIEDQHRAWQRLLGTLMPHSRPLDALLVQGLFLGKLIRILSTGATTPDLADVRAEFARDLRAINGSRYWI